MTLEQRSAVAVAAGLVPPDASPTHRTNACLWVTEVAAGREPVVLTTKQLAAVRRELNRAKGGAAPTPHPDR